MCYWQVEMDLEDRENTVFTVASGLWQYTAMPFALCNAPVTFEGLMETLSKGQFWKTCLVYMDDINAVGNSFEDNFKNLEQASMKLLHTGLKLIPKKFQLFWKEVRYLGDEVSREGILEKIQAVIE